MSPPAGPSRVARSDARRTISSDCLRSRPRTTSVKRLAAITDASAARGTKPSRWMSQLSPSRNRGVRPRSAAESTVIIWEVSAWRSLIPAALTAARGTRMSRAMKPSASGVASETFSSM
ncbi:MAG: hypothetical protein RL354_2569 [Planctomycetota bacterium]